MEMIIITSQQTLCAHLIWTFICVVEKQLVQLFRVNEREIHISLFSIPVSALHERRG